MKWLTTTTSLSFHCAHTGLGSDDLSICELCTPPSASFLEAATAQSLGTSHCTCHHFLPKNGGSSWISTFSLGFSNVSTVFSSVWTQFPKLPDTSGWEVWKVCRFFDLWLKWWYLRRRQRVRSKEGAIFCLKLQRCWSFGSVKLLFNDKNFYSTIKQSCVCHMWMCCLRIPSLPRCQEDMWFKPVKWFFFL